MDPSNTKGDISDIMPSQMEKISNKPRYSISQGIRRQFKSENKFPIDRGIMRYHKESPIGQGQRTLADLCGPKE